MNQHEMEEFEKLKRIASVAANLVRRLGFSFSSRRVPSYLPQATLMSQLGVALLEAGRLHPAKLSMLEQTVHLTCGQCGRVSVLRKPEPIRCKWCGFMPGSEFDWVKK